MFIFTAKTHLILYAYNIPNVFLLLLVNSILYSHKISLLKIQLPENKKQVNFNTNNSPYWGLTVSFSGIRRLAMFPVSLSKNSKSKRCRAYSFSPSEAAASRASVWTDCVEALLSCSATKPICSWWSNAQKSTFTDENGSIKNNIRHGYL